MLTNECMDLRICVCAASGVPAVFIACIGFIDCELRYVAVTILCLTYFINSCGQAGFMANHVDISPKYDIFFLYYVQAVIINRLRLGHCRLTHSYLVSGDDQPVCES